MRASLLCLALVLLSSCRHSAEQSAGPAPSVATARPVQYQLARTLKVGGEGGWDYVTLDPKGTRLYLTRTTHTIVVDANSGQTLADIPGSKRAHGVALAPQSGRGFISDGESGAVILFDLANNSVLGTVAASADADGIIYDKASHRVWVACGDAGAVVGIPTDVDPHGGKADAPIQLGGKPEFLVADGRGKLFIALQDKGQVAVVDTNSAKVVAHWRTSPGESPTGMVVDRAAGRLFVGCRNQKMIVMDASNGAVLADLPIGQGVDATAFDRGNGLASCGDGTLTVVRPVDGKYQVAQVVKTERGARTMAVDPHTGRIYLATADFEASAASPSAGAPRRPKPISGTFRILVVEPVR